jgi:hypothetical protein
MKARHLVVHDGYADTVVAAGNITMTHYFSPGLGGKTKTTKKKPEQTRKSVRALLPFARCRQCWRQANASIVA